MAVSAANPVRTMTRPASRAPQAVQMAEMFEEKSRPWSALWARWFRISEMRPPGRPAGIFGKTAKIWTESPPAGGHIVLRPGSSSAFGGLRGKGLSPPRQLLITCAAGLDVDDSLFIEGVGLAGEVVLQGGEAVLSHEEGQQLFRVRLGGIQLEGILPLRCPAGVAAVELPAAALHRLLHLVLRAAHSWPRGPSGPSAATAGPMTSASAALTTCWPRTGT